MSIIELMAPGSPVAAADPVSFVSTASFQIVCCNPRTFQTRLSSLEMGQLVVKWRAVNQVVPQVCAQEAG